MRSSRAHSLNLYSEHYVETGYERLGLFQLLANHFPIEHVLYPGCFIHVTPSFVFPSIVYVDNDKRAPRFFNDPAVYQYVSKRKAYHDDAEIRFHAADYRTGFDEPQESFDLLISQYAGFVSRYCKHYLKLNGLLLANNSHGDAGLASFDPVLKLIAVIHRHRTTYRLSRDDLTTYFVPKSGKTVTEEYVEKVGRGIGYLKTADAYVFRREA